MGSTLSAVLIEQGALTQAQVAQAQSLGASRGLPLEKAIGALGLATEEVVYEALAGTAGLGFVDLGQKAPGQDVIARIPVEQIEQNGALPVAEKDGCLYVAIDDPVKVFVADTLEFIAGCEVRCVLAAPKALKDAIGRIAAGKVARPSKKAASAAKGDDPDAPIIRLVENTIQSALDARASDIHVEPFEGRVRVRFRVDGVLREHASLEETLMGPLTSRLKIMASMDIAEKRKPQDGRISFRASDRSIDVRTSVLPSSHGETIVMRLLDKEEGLRSLESLGFGGEDNERFQNIIKRPNGVFLVTGPTGSGKTTSLYAALKTLNRSDTKIITAEDPVEFDIAGINQCQVHSRIGLTFARILRSMLRQAPNIILVGEIRDAETAEIAIQAALTGHLVFSTLHTNDAPSAITRLIDMGAKPFLVSASVQAVMAQRLVRVLCKECSIPYRPSETEIRSLALEPERFEDVEFRGPRGCPACDQTGYRGRIGLFELMAMDNNLREMVFRGESTVGLRSYARTSAGMRSLKEDGIAKVTQGITSVEELLRVTSLS